MRVSSAHRSSRTLTSLLVLPVEILWRRMGRTTDREKRFQGGGHAVISKQKRRDRGVPSVIKIKKRRGKHRVEEWATDSFT